MDKIETYLNKNLSKEILEEIIKIKSIAWHYDNIKQKEWLDNNLKENDIHVFYLKEGKRRAYLNLVDLVLKIDGKSSLGYGIGNVCASVKGLGYGKNIMLFTNKLLVEQQRVGLLFCKEALINFYTSCGWELIIPMKMKRSDIDESTKIMIYNYQNELSSIEYNGKLF